MGAEALRLVEPNPGDADAVPLAQPLGAGTQGVHPSDGLVAENDRQAGRRPAPLGLVELRVTDTTARDLEENFMSLRYRYRNFNKLKRIKFVSEITSFL